MRESHVETCTAQVISAERSRSARIATQSRGSHGPRDANSVSAHVGEDRNYQKLQGLDSYIRQRRESAPARIATTTPAARRCVRTAALASAPNDDRDDGFDGKLRSGLGGSAGRPRSEGSPLQAVAARGSERHRSAQSSVSVRIAATPERTRRKLTRAALGTCVQRGAQDRDRPAPQEPTKDAALAVTARRGSQRDPPHVVRRNGRRQRRVSALVEVRNQ